MIRALIVAAALLGSGVIAAVQACTVLKIMWWMEDDSTDPLFRFVQKGKVGYIDVKGKVVLPASLSATEGEFHEGLLPLHEGEGTRYIDRTGKTILRMNGYGSNFSESRAEVTVGRNPSKSGFLDTTGRLAIEARYDSVGPFSEGLAIVALHSGDWEPWRLGYVDRQGRVVIPLSLSAGGEFHEGRAAVILTGSCRAGSSCGKPYVPMEPNSRTDCRWAFIDQTARPISKLRFDDAGDFSEGLAAVKIGGLWGYVDRLRADRDQATV